MICPKCGNDSYSFVGEICSKCYEEQEKKRIEDALTKINNASDFKTWKLKDLSEAFWTHLGKYQKEPNAESFGIMDMAFRWACHDNHGLANSFSHALKWAKIDLYEESLRWKKKG